MSVDGVSDAAMVVSERLTIKEGSPHFVAS
jgi:hypothetical protein